LKFRNWPAVRNPWLPYSSSFHPTPARFESLQSGSFNHCRRCTISLFLSPSEICLYLPVLFNTAYRNKVDSSCEMGPFPLGDDFRGLKMLNYQNTSHVWKCFYIEMKRTNKLEHVSCVHFVHFVHTASTEAVKFLWRQSN